EFRYPDFPGLNLSREVLEGQTLRAEKVGGALADDNLSLAPLLEVQVVDLADSITYDAHDADDAVKLRLVTLENMAEVALVRDAAERMRARYGTLTDTMLRQSIVHELIDAQVGDVLSGSGRELLARGFQSTLAARQSDFRIRVSDRLAAQKRELESYLY